MISVHIRNDIGESFTIRVNSQGKGENFRKNKSYWNNKIKVGRSMTDANGNPIIYLESMIKNTEISRRHLEIDLTRIFNQTTWQIPYKLIVLLMCLRRKQSHLPDTCIKILTQFLKPAKMQKDYLGQDIEKFIRVRDLGSVTGTLIVVKQAILSNNDSFMLVDKVLKILKLQNTYLDYTEGFFRGIEPSDIIRIDSGFFGNIDADASYGEEGDCGFPHLRCTFNGATYLLIATDEKSEFTIGRLGECDIIFNSDVISRTQATIKYCFKNKHWIIIDGSLNKPSSNGTYRIITSGRREKKSQWYVLDHNLIKFKDITITIEY